MLSYSVTLEFGVFRNYILEPRAVTLTMNIQITHPEVFQALIVVWHQTHSIHSTVKERL